MIDGIRKILDSTKKQEDTLQSTLFELGNAKYMLGALDEARVAYTKAIELKPDYARAYNNRGHLFSDLKKYSKAEEGLTKAIELKSDYAEAYNNRGDLLHRLNPCKKAVTDVKKAKELYQKKGDQEGVAFCENLLKDWDRE